MELLTTSWPFDSDPNVTYDDLGYPILDRAVGADTMQRTFAQYFSNGVFRTPSNAFRISAGSGLTVNVQPGMAIINGGMAGWWDEPKAVTLSATAPQWLTHYAIFLRYDNNDDMRGIYLRVDASAAGGSVPEPQSAANVTELRIGYVTVSANATDLSGATIVNEVGTSMAPIAMPLFDVDPTAILEDLRQKADEAYQMYYDLLISAVDDTTAGLLQEQINAQGERITALEGDETDPLALRKEMGLGDTLGVLQPEYGGTGTDSFDSLLDLLFGEEATVCSIDLNVYGEYTIYGLPDVTFEAGWYLMTAEVEATRTHANGTTLMLPGSYNSICEAFLYGTGRLAFCSSSTSYYYGTTNLSEGIARKNANIVYFPAAKTYSTSSTYYKLTSYEVGTFRWKCRKLTCFD